VPFALPLVRGAHHHERDVALGGQFDGAADGILGFDELHAHSGPVHPLSLLAVALEHDLVGFARRQIDDRGDLDAAHSEERMTARGDGAGSIDDALTIDEQSARAHLHQRKHVLTGVLDGDDTGGPEMEGRLGNAFVLTTDHHDATVGPIDAGQLRTRSDGTVVDHDVESRFT
jgi:hypothetical protein